MKISIDERLEKFAEKSVEDGFSRSASEIVEEGLRLIEARDAALLLVRQRLERSIADGGDISQSEMDDALDATTADLKSKGY